MLCGPLTFLTLCPRLWKNAASSSASILLSLFLSNFRKARRSSNSSFFLAYLSYGTARPRFAASNVVPRAETSTPLAVRLRGPGQTSIKAYPRFV